MFYADRVSPWVTAALAALLMVGAAHADGSPEISLPFEDWAVARVLHLKVPTWAHYDSGAVVLEPLDATAYTASCTLPVGPDGTLHVRWSDLASRPHCQSIFEYTGERAYLLQTTDGRTLARLVRGTPPQSDAALTMHVKADGGIHWGGAGQLRPSLGAPLASCSPQTAWLDGPQGLRRINLGGCTLDNPSLFLPTRDSRWGFDERPARAILKIKDHGGAGRWLSVPVRYLDAEAADRVKPFPIQAAPIQTTPAKPRTEISHGAQISARPQDQLEAPLAPVVREGEIYSGAVMLGVSYAYMPTLKRYEMRPSAAGSTLKISDDPHQTELNLGYSWFFDGLSSSARMAWGRGFYGGISLLSTHGGSNPFRALHLGMDVLTLTPGTAITVAFTMRRVDALKNGYGDGDVLPLNAEAPTRSTFGGGVSVMLNLAPRLIAR